MRFLPIVILLSLVLSSRGESACEEVENSIAQILRECSGESWEVLNRKLYDGTPGEQSKNWRCFHQAFVKALQTTFKELPLADVKSSTIARFFINSFIHSINLNPESALEVIKQVSNIRPGLLNSEDIKFIGHIFFEHALNKANNNDLYFWKQLISVFEELPSRFADDFSSQAEIILELNTQLISREEGKLSQITLEQLARVLFNTSKIERHYEMMAILLKQSSLEFLFEVKNRLLQIKPNDSPKTMANSLVLDAAFYHLTVLLYEHGPSQKKGIPEFAKERSNQERQSVLRAPENTLPEKSLLIAKLIKNGLEDLMVAFEEEKITFNSILHAKLFEWLSLVFFFDRKELLPLRNIYAFAEENFIERPEKFFEQWFHGFPALTHNPILVERLVAFASYSEKSSVLLQILFEQVSAELKASGTLYSESVVLGDVANGNSIDALISLKIQLENKLLIISCHEKFRQSDLN